MNRRSFIASVLAAAGVGVVKPKLLLADNVENTFTRINRTVHPTRLAVTRGSRLSLSDLNEVFKRVYSDRRAGDVSSRKYRVPS